MKNQIQNSQILDESPVVFVKRMLAKGIKRGYILNGIITSTNELTELAMEVNDLPDFKNHEALFFEINEESKCLFFVAVNSTIRGQSQGGTRYKKYNTFGDIIIDALRLSLGMTLKNAIAGLHWGGGKSIIHPYDDSITSNPEKRKIVFENFGKFIASLNGVYICAEDMGCTPKDMLTILSVCRFVTCTPEIVGGSGNPSSWTALGIFKAMLACIKYHENKDSLEGKTILIQGLGNVGMELARLVYKVGAKLIVSDVDAVLCNEVNNWGSNTQVVAADAGIYSIECDIFAPCAIGGILNEDTIPMLKCKYVIGAANNQLKKPDCDFELLNNRGIIYLPDFFINRMGIINCANEQYGRVEDDLVKAADKIYVDVFKLLADSEKNNVTPQETAILNANIEAKIEHPIYGHRGPSLVNEVIKKWNSF